MSASPTECDPLMINGVSVVLLLLVLPLTSVGTTDGPAVLWWLGLVFLVIGGATTIVTEFVLGVRS